MNIDPLAEKYMKFSPYVYIANSPIIYVDPNGMEIINGETLNRLRNQAYFDRSKQKMNEMYDGNLDMTKDDFSGNRKKWREYKKNLKEYKKKSEELEKSIEAEAKVQEAIDNFKAIDPENFEKANNLTYIDGNGNEQDIDINLSVGNVHDYGGAKTEVAYIVNGDKSFQSIKSINATFDFALFNPTSFSLAHELGHAYYIAKNPSMSMNDGYDPNCQAPNNRNTLQSKTAMDWQERYMNLKAAHEKNKKNE